MNVGSAWFQSFRDFGCQRNSLRGTGRRADTMNRRSKAHCTVARWALVLLACAMLCNAARTTPQLGNAANLRSKDENLQEDLLNRVARTLQQAGPFPPGARVVEVNSEEVSLICCFTHLNRVDHLWSCLLGVQPWSEQERPALSLDSC